MRGVRWGHSLRGVIWGRWLRRNERPQVTQRTPRNERPQRSPQRDAEGGLGGGRGELEFVDRAFVGEMVEVAG